MRWNIHLRLALVLRHGAITFVNWLLNCVEISWSAVCEIHKLCEGAIYKRLGWSLSLCLPKLFVSVLFPWTTVRKYFHCNMLYINCADDVEKQAGKFFCDTDISKVIPLRKQQRYCTYIRLISLLCYIICILDILCKARWKPVFMLHSSHV